MKIFTMQKNIFHFHYAKYMWSGHFFFSFFCFTIYIIIIIKLSYDQYSLWSPLRTEKAGDKRWDDVFRWEALLSCHAEVTGPQSICNTAVRLADKHSPASESRGRIDDSLDSSYFRGSVCGDLCRAALVSAAALADGALNCAPQPTEAV